MPIHTGSVAAAAAARATGVKAFKDSGPLSLQRESEGEKEREMGGGKERRGGGRKKVGERERQKDKLWQSEKGRDGVGR